MKLKKYTCSNCGVSGKDHGEQVGIIYECDGDFDNPCFQEWLISSGNEYRLKEYLRAKREG